MDQEKGPQANLYEMQRFLSLGGWRNKHRTTDPRAMGLDRIVHSPAPPLCGECESVLTKRKHRLICFYCKTWSGA